MKVKICFLFIFMLIFLHFTLIQPNKLTRHRKKHKQRHRKHKSHKYHSHSHKTFSKSSRKSKFNSKTNFIETNPLIPNILPINPSIDINQLNPNGANISGVNSINNLSNENINQMILSKLSNNQRKNHSTSIYKLIFFSYICKKCQDNVRRTLPWLQSTIKKISCSC